MKAMFRPFIMLLMLMLLQSSTNNYAVSPTAPSISGKVVDFKTGEPIPNATIIIWDLNALKSSIYFTDENGTYSISGSFIKLEHTYRIYAFRGNFTQKIVDYIPSVKKIEIASWKEYEVNFRLVPGALIELNGSWYLVQASSPGSERAIFLKVLNEDGSPLNLHPDMVDEYGYSIHAWFLKLKRNLIIIPADMPVIIRAQIWVFSTVERRIRKENIILYNGSLAFNLPQGFRRSLQISDYSLRRGLDITDAKFSDVLSQIDEAQSIGFVVFEERRMVMSSKQKIMEANSLLTRAKDEEDYLKVWSILRAEIERMNLVSRTLQNMRLISKTSAVYLSAVMAAFSIVLAFFLFEEKKKKMISSIMIYFAFLVALYFLYPGAQIVISENKLLFIVSAAVSFSAVLAFVFGIPYVWKERVVEGEVSWRSAISIIFSMGKRQIRRRKIRGFFTILSIIILILAFTSLTSFGTVFGIVSDKISGSSPADGILVKRVMNETSLLFTPLGSEDPATLSKIINIKNVAPRVENIPSYDPIAVLRNPKTKDRALIYGILGIDPANETKYASLDKIIEEGEFLSENGEDEILIGPELADILNVRINETITLDIQGISGVSRNFTVRGIFDGEKYANLLDLDGKPYGPARILSDGTLRTCNSTEIIIMNWKAAESLQNIADALNPEGAPQFAVLSEIAFQTEGAVDIDSIIRPLILVFNYDVFVSSNREITYFHIGSYVEVKGTAELLVPLVMVGLNVGMVMLNSVYERRKELRTLLMLGLNPTHIGLIFLAEAIILGMVGGSLGYLFGLGFYRIIVLLNQDLMVREKLEWWWSAIGFAIAIAASVMSAIRPAILAVNTYTPSKIRKHRLSEEKAEERKEKIFKVYQAKEYSMPVKIKLNEIEFFVSYLLSRLDELKSGYTEKIENIEEMPEIENVKGELVRTIKFDYYFEISGRRRGTRNSLIITKAPKEEYYRVKLISEPAVPGMPEDAIDRTVDVIFDMMMYWAKNKERIIG